LGRPASIFHPDFAGLVRYTSAARPDDDELATAQTIAEMSRLIREDSRSRPVRELALRITAGAVDDQDLIARLFYWVKGHIRFRDDSETAALGNLPEPAWAEVLIRPLDLLAMPQPTGDCDDFAMLTAALLRALGVDASLVTIATVDPQLYSHVYVIATLRDGGRINLDTSHGPEPGWCARPVGKFREWSIEPMQSSLNGVGDIDWGSIIESSVDTAGDIFKAKWGQPPPGTYIQQGQNITYRQQPGSTALQFPTAQLGTMTTGTIILIAVIGLVLMLVLARK